MNTADRLTRLLDIDLAIIQAPMAGASTAELAAAVSNAGGLGSLGTAMMTPSEVRAQTGALRALTNKPFNLNFFVHAEPDIASHDGAAMRGALKPYFDERGLGEVPEPASPAQPRRAGRFAAACRFPSPHH